MSHPSRLRSRLALAAAAALGAAISGCAQGGDARELADSSAPAVASAAVTAQPPELADSAAAPALAEGSVGAATRDHRLTMAEMQTWSSVIKALKARARTDPNFKLTLAYPPASSLESQAQVAGENPALREALRSNGLSARDWVVVTAAYISASIAAQTDDPAHALAPDVNAENVAFLREHGPAINALQR